MAAQLEQGAILQELPLADLFSAPLLAAARAQAGMAANTILFLREFGLDSEGKVLMTTMSSSVDIPKDTARDLSGDYLLDPRTFNSATGPRTFRFIEGGTRNVNTTEYTNIDEDGTKIVYANPNAPEAERRIMGYEKQIGTTRYLMDDAARVMQVQGIRTISVPFITLINVPSLAMNLVTIDFCISIKTQSAVTTSTTTGPVSNTTAEVVNSVPFTTNYSDAWDRGSAGFGRNVRTSTTGTIASTEVAKSETTTTSTYQVSLKAKQKQPPGMKILLDFVSRNKDAAPKRTIVNSGGFAVVGQDASVQGIRGITGE
jgi:hypothetical protein